MITMKKARFKPLIVAAVILVLAVSVGLFARWKYYNPDLTCTKALTRIFKQVPGYRITDQLGDEVTEEFIAEYADLYHAGNFRELDNILKEKNYSISYVYGSYTPSSWGESEYGEIPTPFR
jgi:hypothetical protein